MHLKHFIEILTEKVEKITEEREVEKNNMRKSKKLFDKN